MKPILKLLAPIMALALVAAACGDDDEPADTGTAAAPTTAAATSSGTDADAAVGGEITIMSNWGGAEQAGIEEVLAAFTAATGIETTYVSERDQETVLPIRIAGGSPPDVSFFPRPGQVQEFVDDEVLVPFTDIGVDMGQLAQNYSQSVLDLGKFNGEQYGLVFAVNSKSTFWYKPDSFEAQGFSEPDTVDELDAIIEGYVDAGLTPLTIGGLDGWTLTDWFENLYVRVAGPENYNKLFVTHEIEWTDPTVVETLKIFRDLISPVDEVVLGGAAGANSTGFIDAFDQVLGGDAEMYYEGGFMGNFARDNFPDLVGGTDYTFFPFPEIDPAYGKPVVGGGSFLIAFNDSPQVKAFIDYMASPEASEVWATAEEGARINPNLGVSTDLFTDPLTALEAQAILDADIFVFDGSDLAPAAVGGDAMFTGLQNFLDDPDDIDGVTEFIETAADGAY